MHHLRAVGREFDHLGVAHAIDRVGARDPARVARHHAAHVGEDLDRFGAERVAEGDRGEVAAAASERRHGARFGHALKPGHDGDHAAFEQAEHVVGHHAQDLRVAERVVGDDAGLAARHRLRVRAP